jgi:hypothetical protein
MEHDASAREDRRRHGARAGVVLEGPPGARMATSCHRFMGAVLLGG